MNHLVAVYGSLRNGYGNHVLLETAMYLGTEKTEAVYTMLHLGGFPGVLLDGETSITIEIYSVDDKTFQRLDHLEGYPSFYNRKQIPTEYGMAWMYYLEEGEGYSNVYVPSGDWSDVKEAW